MLLLKICDGQGNDRIEEAKSDAEEDTVGAMEPCVNIFGSQTSNLLVNLYYVRKHESASDWGCEWLLEWCKELGADWSVLLCLLFVKLGWESAVPAVLMLAYEPRGCIDEDAALGVWRADEGTEQRERCVEPVWFPGQAGDGKISVSVFP